MRGFALPWPRPKSPAKPRENAEFPSVLQVIIIPSAIRINRVSLDVGYQNIGYDKSGWMMNVAVQFDNVESEDGSFEIGEKFFNGTATEGDQIYTIDAAAWDVNQSNKQGEGLGWVLYPADGGASEYFAAIRQKRGDFVYYAPLDATAVSEVTVPGAVAKLGEQSVTFEPTDENWMFSLVNPFPIDTTWGELNTFTTETDQIFTLDAVAWDVNQYNRQPDGYGWTLYPADGGDSEHFTDEEEVALQAGEAAYYAPTKTTTWTVTL